MMVGFFRIYAEFMEGARSWRLWSKFAWHDLLARYRRSWVGPLWLAVSAVVFITTLTLVYGTLFGKPLKEYLPFLAVGVACWSFIQTVTSEAVGTFVEAEQYIRQMRVNLFIFVFRVLWRNVLVFLHQFAVAGVVVVLTDRPSTTLLSLAAIGVFFMFVQGFWIIPVLGLLGTRFRDLQPITTNLLQVLFFVTPVLWAPSALGPHQWIADINPVTSLIAIVRDPMLGTLPAVRDYAFVMALTVVGIGFATIFYSRFYKRVVYWL